jgi:hypothetical protein
MGATSRSLLRIVFACPREALDVALMQTMGPAVQAAAPATSEAGCGVTVGEGEPFQVLQRRAGRLPGTMRSSWHPLARYFCEELFIVDIYA